MGRVYQKPRVAFPRYAYLSCVLLGLGIRIKVEKPKCSKDIVLWLNVYNSSFFPLPFSIYDLLLTRENRTENELIK